MRLNGTVFFFFLSWQLTVAQEQLFGLWTIEKVQVGDEDMTPVAEWTMINADSTYFSGNGWLTSTEGAWSYKPSSKALSLESFNDIKDTAGPFTVACKENECIWTRLEEGTNVRIFLKRADRKPLAPADHILGLWKLTSYNRGGTDLSEKMNPEHSRYFHMRWDRIFTDNNGRHGRQSGFWHMHGHRPSLTWIYHDQDKDNDYWEVSYSNQTMTWSQNDNDTTLIFERI